MNEGEDPWRKLCREAAEERDPEKLLKLVNEINAILEAKERKSGIHELTPPAENRETGS